jgi:(2Fe-2S) ferredoxin
MSPGRKLYVCINDRFGTSASCAGGGSRKLIEQLRYALYERGLEWSVEENRCMGHCPYGPNLKAAPGGRLLRHCVPEQAGRIVDALNEAWEGGSLDARDLTQTDN